jgi:hypothetical protein
MTSRLFSPFTLRGLELDNRIVVSPMAHYSACEMALQVIGTSCALVHSLYPVWPDHHGGDGRPTLRPCQSQLPWPVVGRQIDGLRNVVNFSNAYGNAKSRKNTEWSALKWDSVSNQVNRVGAK